MRFEVERDVIVDALKKMARLRAPSALVPNLDKVRVEATADTVRFLGTNLTQILRVDVTSADISETGAAIFPRPSEMIQFLSSLPDGSVLFDVSGASLLISSGKAKTTRQLTQPKDFPALPDLDVVKTWHQIPAGLFRDDLSAVLSVAERADSPHFSQVTVVDGAFYGSDGLHAHVQEVSGYQCPDMSLSASAAPLLKALVLTSDVEYVDIGFAKSATLFRTSEALLLSYSPTVEMPDVKSSIVSAALSNDQILEVDRDEFSRAVRQVSGTTDNFSAIHVLAKDSTISLKSKSDIGQTETSISGNFAHPDQEFILSASSLVSALECYPQQVCKVLLGTDANKAGAKSVSPVRMSANDGEGGSFVAVLSQLRKDLL